MKLYRETWFIVKFTLKNNVNKFGKSYQIAVRRFVSLEKRLSQQNDTIIILEFYAGEYKELGHNMKKIINGNNDQSDYLYLPHSYVLNETNSTTKLRVIFDA